MIVHSNPILSFEQYFYEASQPTFLPTHD